MTSLLHKWNPYTFGKWGDVPSSSLQHSTNFYQWKCGDHLTTLLLILKSCENSQNKHCSAIVYWPSQPQAFSIIMNSATLKQIHRNWFTLPVVSWTSQLQASLMSSNLVSLHWILQKPDLQLQPATDRLMILRSFFFGGTNFQGTKNK